MSKNNVKDKIKDFIINEEDNTGITIETVEEDDTLNLTKEQFDNISLNEDVKQNKTNYEKISHIENIKKINEGKNKEIENKMQNRLYSALGDAKNLLDNYKNEINKQAPIIKINKNKKLNIINALEGFYKEYSEKIIIDPVTAVADLRVIRYNISYIISLSDNFLDIHILSTIKKINGIAKECKEEKSTEANNVFLEEQVYSKIEETKKLEKKLEKLEKEKKEIKDKLKTSQLHVEQLVMNSSNNFQKNEKPLIDENQKLQDEIELLEKEDKNVEIVKLKDENAQYKEEINNLKLVIRYIKDEHDDLINQISLLISQDDKGIIELIREGNEKEKEIQELKYEIVDLTIKNSDFGNNIARLNIVNNKLKEENKSNETLQNDNNDLRQEKHKLEKEKNTLIQQNKDLELKLSTEKKNAKRITEENVVLRKKGDKNKVIGDLQDEIKKKDNTIDDLGNKLDLQGKKMEKLENTLDEFILKNNTLVEEKFALVTKVEKLAKDNVDLRKDNVDLTNKVEKLEKGGEIKDQEIKNIKNENVILVDKVEKLEKDSKIKYKKSEQEKSENERRFEELYRTLQEKNILSKSDNYTNKTEEVIVIESDTKEEIIDSNNIGAHTARILNERNIQNNEKGIN